MVEISDIKDRESLRAWLEALPFDEDENRRIAVTIAHRAAMRVLPQYWQLSISSASARKNDLTALPILRCSLISGVAGTMPTPEIRSAAFAAFAADAAFAANAAANAAAAWKMIRADCTALATGDVRLDQTPLWSGANPVSENWVQTRETLPEGWDFWRDWYQNALDGVKPNWDMLTEIALIEPADWDKGADHVNGVIADIQLKYAVAASPNAEDLIVNDDGKYQAVPRSELPALTLDDVQNRLRDVLADIRQAQQQESNQYQPLLAEADLLEGILARYPENALRLFEECTKVAVHIGRKVSDGVLPQKDNLISDITGDVQNSADDIYNFDPEVRKTVDARSNLRFGRLSDGQKADISRLAEAVAKNSVEQFAEELREDALVVSGEIEPSAETAPDRYRLSSRLLKVAKIGGAGLVAVVGLLAGAEPAVSGAQYLWQIIAPLVGF